MAPEKLPPPLSSLLSPLSWPLASREEADKRRDETSVVLLFHVVEKTFWEACLVYAKRDVDTPYIDQELSSILYPCWDTHPWCPRSLFRTGLVERHWISGGGRVFVVVTEARDSPTAFLEWHNCKQAQYGTRARQVINST